MLEAWGGEAEGRGLTQGIVRVGWGCGAGRAKELAAEQNVPNAQFQVMDALKMTYPVSLRVEGRRGVCVETRLCDRVGGQVDP